MSRVTAQTSQAAPSVRVPGVPPPPPVPGAKSADLMELIVPPPAGLTPGKDHHPPAVKDHHQLCKRAIDLFTFLRELVSLRTTVVRKLESYDRVLWLDHVPREPECDCVAFPKARREDEEGDDFWLRIRKPNFSEPPHVTAELAPWVDAAQLRDSSLEAPRPLERIDARGDAAHEEPDANDAAGLTVAQPVPAFTRLQDHPEVRSAWDRYVAEKWRPWAEEDRRKRRVLRIYTDLFSLYQQQKELGEAYEVVVALGQLRWELKPGVEVNRHLVVAQTSIEFDAQRGVIVVGPAAEGAKPRLEEDMLEPDERPAPTVVSALEAQIAQCDDDIWRNEQMIAAIKSFAHSLGSGDGSYANTLEPIDAAGPSARMRWAPAIILRRRNEQGLLRVYGRILEDLKQRTEIPQGLLPLVEIGSNTRPEREESNAAVKSNSNAGPADNELMFPLPFNDEQREIVRRLEAQRGVVVQGPPGTGKSHTIANLVCQLLATGNRVLVTSHAPRALRILKEKIPQAITNMCVVLLGNDRTALAELEASVQVITQRLNTWNARERQAAVKDLEAQLANLRQRAAEVDKNMRAVRESDTFRHPLMPGGYEGTLQAVARKLRERQAEYNWITQFVQGLDLDKLPEAPSIANNEATELLQGLRSLDSQKRQDLRRELPPAAEIIPTGELEKLVNDERNAAQNAEQARAAIPPEQQKLLPDDLEADESTLGELCELLERIVRQNTEMENHHFSWVPRLAKDVRSGQFEPWRVLLEQTQAKLQAIRHHPAEISELEVIGAGDIDMATVHNDAELLCKHMESGGKIKQMFRYVSPAKERAYIFESVQIGGKRIKNLETLKMLRAWTDVQHQFKALAQLWSDIAEAPIGAVMRRVPVWTERCGIIEAAGQLNTLIERAKGIFRRLPMVKPPVWHQAEQLQLLHKQLKVRLVEQQHATRTKAIDALVEQILRKATSNVAHPIGRTLADAVKRRDTEAYRVAREQLAQLWIEREKMARGDELLKKLSESLPKVARALSEDPGDPAWESRMANLHEAWLWLRTDRWLKQQLDPKYFEYLQTERKSLQEQLQATMVKLAAEKAWFHCMTRMTPAEETYLKAWVQAIRNIGAGTGKRANRFRKVARQTLDRCRTAIPAWIMPIHRVAETVSPGEDLFDVVIVDEASQSGPEALFLHYIAKKIIIVGDDKQIAPYNVGINRDDVERLRSRYIPDLPLTDYFDLDHSFFDQGYLRFGNRIRLCEHFRCMPEIIQFSNNLCYNNEPLIPLRQFADGRLEPVVVARHVPGGHMEGASPSVVNRAEAEAITKQIAKLIADPAYRDKTMGVISLLGDKQARLIEERLLSTIGPEEMERRRLICGDAYSFQGDERHVMFLSLTVSSEEGRRLATLTQAADERRFNVAASRAQEQMWLFHSLTPDDLSPKCLRRQLLEYCIRPEIPQEAAAELPEADIEALAATADRTKVRPPPPFESWLEVDVYLHVRQRGYRVVPQYAFAGYRIDLVINGMTGRLALECNGEEWPGQDRYEVEMARQRQLERCGWRFWRIRGGAFYRNPDAALQPLWELLDKQGIRARAANTPPMDLPPSPRLQKAEAPKEEPKSTKDLKAPKESTSATAKPAAPTEEADPKPAPKKRVRRPTKTQDDAKGC